MTMTKENRAEIRTLKAAGKKVESDYQALLREKTKAMRQHLKAVDRLDREAVQIGKNRLRAVGHIDRRIAILEGRLA